jgi:uncharacterized protein (DUF2267 family)
MKGVTVMGQNEFARAVAERWGLSQEEAADLTRAVLEALAGQLSNGEARRLAMEFPDFVAEPWPLSAKRRTGAHPVPVEEFVRQVSGRTGLTAGRPAAVPGPSWPPFGNGWARTRTGISSGSCLRRTWSWRNPRGEPRRRVQIPGAYRMCQRVECTHWRPARSCPVIEQIPATGKAITAQHTHRHTSMSLIYSFTARMTKPIMVGSLATARPGNP